jgi:2-polyprenyl-6-methoxyphenol hydroxylase-like FAD-dependent oxidoreductase
MSIRDDPGMTTVCINGAGLAGLTTALLLAADGHEVTLVDRDPPPPSRDPEVVWEEWSRRSVPQLRQTHAFLGRFRQLVHQELPHAWIRLLEAGVAEHSVLAHPPLTVTEPVPRDGDDDIVVMLGRRCTVEAVLRHVAEDEPRIEIRPGTVTKGLLARGSGPPQATGLATSTGPIDADLVVDCGGSRSAIADWIDEAGGHRPYEQLAEYRIAYWTQWFRTRPGAATPVLHGPPVKELGPIEVLTLPADSGWFSITVVATAGDKRFRVLGDQARLLRFLRALEVTREWVDPAVAEPSGGVVPKVTPVDGRRRLVVDDRPCVTGLVGVGDSVGSTNPSLGRGATFAFMHAVALRDLLRDSDDPTTITDRHDADLMSNFDPWWQATVTTDQEALARMQADVDGTEPPPAGPSRLFRHAAFHDAELWPLGARVANVLELPEQIVAQPGVLERVGVVLGRVGPPTPSSIDVEALLDA